MFIVYLYSSKFSLSGLPYTHVKHIVMVLYINPTHCIVMFINRCSGSQSALIVCRVFCATVVGSTFEYCMSY